MESLKTLYETVLAIYNTTSSVANFIGTLTGWFGFGPLLALVGLLFFFKIYQSVLPGSRLTNFILSFASLTALWLTWNLNYYKDYHLPVLARTYGSIFFLGAVLFCFDWLLRFCGRTLYRLIRKNRVSLNNTLAIYEKIDELTLVMKQRLKQQDISGAKKALEELQQTFHNLANRHPQRTSTLP